MRQIAHVLRLAHGEARAVGWAFTYFFLLLASYYILRPLRDEMGIAGGVEKLPWVFTGTFIAMLAAVPLFGYITARLPRRQFLPLAYGFFILNLLVFYAAFQMEDWHAVTARAFFIWVSVFNLFVVSVFWSFMVDLFSPDQGKRLFGLIAAGGTAGAIAGPLLTALLAATLGPAQLLPVSAVLLAGAIVCIQRLNRWSSTGPRAAARTAVTPLGGSVFAGLTTIVGSPYLLGIALFLLLFTTLSTFLYFEQAHIVARSFAGAAERTRFFALLDLTVNSLTVFLQVLVTSRALTRLGVAGTLLLVPILSTLGFGLLGLAPTVIVLAGFQALRRAGDYALTRPARELLFTVVDREAKYKAKNVLDTLIYRGGDVVSGWLFAALSSAGLGLPALAWLAALLAIVWGGVAWHLGRRQAALSRREA